MVQQTIYEFGPYSLDPSQMLLHRSGSVVPLQPRALETLLVLLRQRGEVVSKQELMEKVWRNSFVEEGNLTQNIFLLRRELGETPEGEEYIQTIPKRGYRMNVPVRESNRNGETRIPSTVSPGKDDTETHTRISDTTGLVGGTSRSVAAWSGLVMLVVLALGISAIAFWRSASVQPTVSGYLRITHDGSLKSGKASQVGGPDAKLFADGSRIYFMEGSADAPFIAQVSATGGETGRIAVPIPLPELMDYSSGRSELLVGGTVDEASPMPLWVVPVPAGAAHRLGAIVAWDASWSPDGRELAYTRGRELYLAKSDGSNSKLLATLPGLGWQPRWSPDGLRLRFSVFDVPTSITSLWEVSREGTGLHRLLSGWNGGARSAGSVNGPINLCCGSWTPDGRYFVFQMTKEGRSDIWAMPGKPSILRRIFPSLAAPTRVTSGQLSSSAPVFSPDGRQLFVIGRQLRGELERYDRRTGEFLPWLGGISASFVDFSRDGQWVAYVAYPEGTLWRSRVDGSERLQLTTPPLSAGVPKWSPDGSKILFYGMGGSEHQRAYIVPANGGGPQPASRGAGAEMQPNWSPDGASIMYSDFPFFSSSSGKVAIHLLSLATQKTEMLPGSEGFFAPCWSPNGRYVAALAPSGQRIMLFDFKSGAWSELVEGFGLLRWSHDSLYLYYLRVGPDSAVMRVRVDDGRVEELASLKGIRQAGLLAGLDFGVTPDGAPLILRDIGTEEVYSLDWLER